MMTFQLPGNHHFVLQTLLHLQLDHQHHLHLLLHQHCIDQHPIHQGRSAFYCQHKEIYLDLLQCHLVKQAAPLGQEYSLIHLEKRKMIMSYLLSHKGSHCLPYLIDHH